MLIGRCARTKGLRQLTGQVVEPLLLNTARISSAASLSTR
jgi:hypothetical protein